MTLTDTSNGKNERFPFLLSNQLPSSGNFTYKLIDANQRGLDIRCQG